MKNNKNKSLLLTALFTFLPLKYAQANIISFDLESSVGYESIYERTRDGNISDDTVWTSIDTERFSTQINFDLFSENNKKQTQDEYHFVSDGNDLAWWMTIFDYAPQDIYTPFSTELLGLVNIGDYERLNDQYIIFAGGTYHYHDPESDLDVREDIIFRRELSGYTVTSTVDGRVQNGFSYWQQFTIDLPNPKSFDTKTYFDSYSTDQILANFSGSSVRFETYIKKRNWWNNEDNSESSHKFVTNAYVGYGTYNYRSVNVPEPTTIALFLPLTLMCYWSRKRKWLNKLN